MMIVFDLLYQLFIGPLELFFEVLYAIAFRTLGDPGMSIVFLSLAMNLLVLPLYRRADAMQAEERERMARMKPWTDHIKKTFKGDERFMMLQTYNRQNGYKQTDVLKGSVSLLLEIPFFIAAFHFLSNLQLLNGVPFGPIVDLGAPDGFLQVGDLSINVLPILMTVINLVSAAIYMKGLPVANKVQMYGIAAIFLILLYNSPAGLVFYWTLNNVFSLVKNIFYKIKNPALVLSVIVSLVGIALAGVAVFSGWKPSALRAAGLVVIVLALQVPLVLQLTRKTPRKPVFHLPEATAQDDRTFLFLCIFFAVLLGTLIPTSVVAASPAEFVEALGDTSPLFYVLKSTMLAIGMFVIWFGVFYRLATPKGKTVFGCLMLACATMAIVNYLFFGTDFGNLSTQLTFDTPPKVARNAKYLNLAVLACVAIVPIVIWVKKRRIAQVASVCLCVAVIAMSAINVVGISGNVEAANSLLSAGQDDDELHITFSKDGKNVVVLMLDRAISYYIPYLMHEKPELQRMFEGFTFYPNTISFGAYTNTGAPPLYGGADYRPKLMNERDSEPLAEKHNEAMKVMPTLFSENGFNVEILDPTYAGYTWVPDLSIYDGMPNVKAYLTRGQFDVFRQLTETPAEQGGKTEEEINELLPRSFFCYSVFKIVPLALQPTVYHNGDYNSTAFVTAENANDDLRALLSKQVCENESVASGANPSFMKAYAMLQNLPDITRISDGGESHFVMMSNDTPHDPTVLKEPEYVPALHIDNRDYDEKHRKRYAQDGSYLYFEPEKEKNSAHYASKTLHYEVNMAALLQLGAWLDYLRENDVYDNTRIIIVSDHARFLHLDPDLILSVGDDSKGDDKVGSEIDVLSFNCLLMMKDFGADEFTVDNRFMTNADAPVLALSELVGNPVNPFTGNPIDETYKSEPEQHLIFSPETDVDTNNGNTFMPGYWFSLENQDVFKRDNWRYLGKY